MLLAEMKELGVFPANFEEVSISKDVKIVRYEDVRNQPNPVISTSAVCVLGDYEGAATEEGKSVDNASTVRTWKGDTVGSWDANSKTFFLSKLCDNGLNTISLIKFKEDTKMNMEGLMERTTNNMASFPTQGVATEEKKKKGPAISDAVAHMREIVGQTKLVQNPEVRLFNQKYGRLAGFITKTNPAITAKVAKQARLGADGKKMLKPDVDEETRKRFEETPSKVAASNFMYDYRVVFKQQKPGQIVAVILKVPVGAKVDFYHFNKEVEIDHKNTTLETIVLGAEAAYDYIAKNFGDAILEDEGMLGAKASKLQLKVTGRKNKDTQAWTYSTKLAVPTGKDAGRKSLLVEGNYFPAKVYNTISTQGMNADAIATANLNIEALFKNKDKNVYDTLAEDSKAKIKVDGREVKETSWFNKGEAISVLSYENNGTTVSSVEIPTRAKNLSKSGDSYRYDYEYFDIDDAEHGPFVNPVYAKVAENSGLDKQEFIKFVKAYGANSRRKAATSNKLVSIDDYLAAKYVIRSSETGSTPLEDMQRQLLNITM